MALSSLVSPSNLFNILLFDSDYFKNNNNKWSFRENLLLSSIFFALACLVAGCVVSDGSPRSCFLDIRSVRRPKITKEHVEDLKLSRAHTSNQEKVCARRWRKNVPEY